METGPQQQQLHDTNLVLQRKTVILGLVLNIKKQNECEIQDGLSYYSVRKYVACVALSSHHALT